jgi:serine O-acetyltransferase
MLLKIHQLNHLLHRAHVPLIPKIIYALFRIAFAVVLPPSVVVGRGVTLAYSGLGTVIHANARIGNNVYIGPGVIIGGRSELPDVPEVGNDVIIGARATIIGPVRIGAGAKIGAGAVVVKDVPAGATVVSAAPRVLLRGY